MLSKEREEFSEYDYCFVGSGSILEKLIREPHFAGARILLISNQIVDFPTTGFASCTATLIPRAVFLNSTTPYRISNLIILTKSHRWKVNEEFLKLMHKLRQHVSDTVLHVSSGSVYGNIPVKANESTSVFPISNYGISKVLEEDIVFTQFEETKRIIVLRVSNVYGNLSFDDVVNQCFSAIKTGKKMKVYQEGSIVRDFLYINCLVSAVIELLRISSLDGKICFNVSTGYPTSIIGLVAKIEDLTGRRIFVEEGVAPTEVIRSSVLDNSKLLSAINWKPLSLDEGLRLYMDRDFPDFASSV
jgi:dTDP-4-dehydrorhamnose reductase